MLASLHVCHYVVALHIRQRLRCERQVHLHRALRSEMRDGLRILRLLVVLFRDYRPFACFAGIGAGFAAAGLAAGSLPILEFVRTGLVGRFPMAVLAASLMTLSVLLGLTGVLLEANLRYHREAYQIKLREFCCRSLHKKLAHNARVAVLSVFR